MTEIDIHAVRTAAGSTRDPEIRRSLGELGLLDEVQIEGSQVTVHFHLTSPLCPTKFATSIGQEIKKRVEAITGVTSCEVVLRDQAPGLALVKIPVRAHGEAPRPAQLIVGRRHAHQAVQQLFRVRRVFRTGIDLLRLWRKLVLAGEARQPVSQAKATAEIPLTVPSPPGGGRA